MENEKIIYESHSPTCACKVSLDYLGDKWILIIIRDLFRKKYTFSQFFDNSDERIASSVLADRLKKLKSIGAIDFEYLNHNYKAKNYYLTDRGIELYDVIFALQLWTVNNVDFNYSDNTTKWKVDVSEQNHTTYISNFKEEYRIFRKQLFGF
jgi:DNA-binding HxlR family transcriptional regulator